MSAGKAFPFLDAIHKLEPTKVKSRISLKPDKQGKWGQGSRITKSTYLNPGDIVRSIEKTGEGLYRAKISRYYTPFKTSRLVGGGMRTVPSIFGENFDNPNLWDGNELAWETFTQALAKNLGFDPTNLPQIGMVSGLHNFKPKEMVEFLNSKLSLMFDAAKKKIQKANQGTTDEDAYK
jgi:hypothetical protein